MKVSGKTLNSSLKREIQRMFVQLLADLNNPEETSTFLKDFFSEQELENLAKRLAVAYWLKKGRSYENVKKNLKVSTATIANVQNLLKSKGFKLALKKIEAEEWAEQWSKRIKKFVGK